MLSRGAVGMPATSDRGSYLEDAGRLPLQFGQPQIFEGMKICRVGKEVDVGL